VNLALFCVADHANDLKRIDRAVLAVQQNGFPNWIAIGDEAPDECFIYNRDVRRVFVVAQFKIAARAQRNAHGAEVARGGDHVRHTWMIAEP
jgi:hypothetical protein